MYDKHLHGILALLLALFLEPSLAAGSFPGRAAYPDVPVIELDELGRNQDSLTVVDVRSRFEFQTLHINGAHNIPLSSRDFVEQARALRQREGKPLVFYCNGHSCMKSYKATRRAMLAGMRDARCFDAGIFDWTLQFPDRASLLGKSPVSPDRIIRKEDFVKRLLPPEEFSKASMEDVVLLDIRDPEQREGIALFPGRQRSVPLDDIRRIEHYARRARERGIPLLAYDAVGKQVRWLQYHLEDLGLKEYYFMEGGAKGFFGWLRESYRR
jgi:rhodanese-related sulfurtransferase